MAHLVKCSEDPCKAKWGSEAVQSVTPDWWGRSMQISGVQWPASISVADVYSQCIPGSVGRQVESKLKKTSNVDLWPLHAHTQDNTQ